MQNASKFFRISNMNSGKRRSECPISYFLDIFGDKWALLVMRDIMLRKHSHYKDFLNSEEKIATNILADRLQKLEAHGLIVKKRDPKKGNQNIYEPTEKAIDLLPSIIALAVWSNRYDPDSALAKMKLTKEQRDNPEAFIEQALTAAAKSK